VALIEAATPGFALTIDPVENRDFEYHTGLCFHLFAGNVRGELGRGGRYVAGGEFGNGGTEPATGFTLFMDSLLQALPAASTPERLYVPFGTSVETATSWRAKGWIVVAGLAPERDGAQEAKRLNCSHVLVGDKPVKA
jgi:ATP phosphoribosyltransferase regulatory subunit